jgi:hypothetical protein
MRRPFQREGLEAPPAKSGPGVQSTPAAPLPFPMSGLNPVRSWLLRARRVGGLLEAHASDFKVAAVLALERVELALIGFRLDAEQHHFPLA